MTATYTDLGSPKEQFNRQLFDNYGPVNVREAIGTFFLGVLAILLFLALQRSWNRYESLFGRTTLLNQV